MAQENTPLSPQDQLGVLNTLERDKAHAQTKLSHEKRLAENPVPTEEELRVGTYREFLEPQIRDAIFIFNNKGYYTIDSGYHGRHILEGVQYTGFEKGTLSDDILPLVEKVLEGTSVVATIDSDSRDSLVLTPARFVPLEEWKKIWDAVADAFPDLGTPTPIRERFISKSGH